MKDFYHRLRYAYRFKGKARWRAAFWLVIRCWETEICSACGRPVGLVWWCHDDFLWEKVTGNHKPAGSRESAGGIFCIPCFDKAAREVCPWIEWAPLNLRHLQSDEETEISAKLRHAGPASADEEGGRT